MNMAEKKSRTRFFFKAISQIRQCVNCVLCPYFLHVEVHKLFIIQSRVPGSGHK